MVLKSHAKINCLIDIRNSYALAKFQTYEMVKLYREMYNLNAVTGILFNHESPRRSDNYLFGYIAKKVNEIKEGKINSFEISNGLQDSFNGL